MNNDIDTDWQFIDTPSFLLEFEKINTYDILNKNILNNLEYMYILWNIYYNDIMQSFHYSYDNIIKQFYQDIPRCDLIINEKDYKKPLRAFKKIQKILLKNNNIHQLTYVIMLCTQASMGLPLEIVMRFIKLQYQNDNIIIGEDKQRSPLHININYPYLTINKKMSIIDTSNNNLNKIKTIDLNIFVNFIDINYIFFNWY